MRTPTIAFGIAIASFTLPLSAAAQDVPVTLHIGDPAPSIAAGKFLQGDSIPAFKKGTVYFLDFWATWCGPCKHALPYVEALPKKSKYDGKVVVMGMDVWENSHGKAYDLTVVQNFIKGQPDMTYPVVADDEKQDVAKAFVKASGSQGIPTFMIIDKEGKIAWMAVGASDENVQSFEPTLDKVLAGTFDSKAYRASYEQEQTDEKALMAGYKPLGEGKYKEALAIFDSLSPHSPNLMESRNAARLQALIHVDADKGLEYAGELKTQANGDPSKLINIASACADKDLPAKCFAFSVDLFNESIAKRATAMAYFELSYAYKNHGDNGKAIETLQKAISAAKTETMAEDERTGMISFLQSQLKTLQNK